MRCRRSPTRQATQPCLLNAPPCSIFASSHRMSDGEAVRLLIFRVGNLACAAEAATVREILPRFEPTRIPGAPAQVAGLGKIPGSPGGGGDGGGGLGPPAPPGGAPGGSA